ncbi:acyltransferase domain-containing protein [Lentzea alba]|uniref:beta-ketoacyl synthase N-terminal-like domain-containing protein n=1 Tax=Lentzea alba TaxID=2714351 RepID=UPI0039BFA750
MVAIAIVGMSVLLPGAPDLATYWHNLRTGVDAISDAPEDRLDPVFFGVGDDRVHTRRGGFVSPHVDVAQFGMMPASAKANEPDQLIALHVAAQAIDDAGGADRLPNRERVGVIIGRGGYLTSGMAKVDSQLRGAEQVLQTIREIVPNVTEDQLRQVKEAFRATTGPLQNESAFGMVPNLSASRIANRLDLGGPAYVVDAACASSLLAVDQAVTELVSGRSDVMLAGGTHHCHDISLWNGFSRLKALSGSGRIRPFHRDADGILIGEGTGIVVLKRLQDAERDGDRVYAVIRGTGVASDGKAGSVVNPEPDGQELAVRRAWEMAGLDPADADSLGYLEAHGTATPTGDLAELVTIARVFGPAGTRRPVLGSVKSMIGHTMPAAGVASLVKTALAVYHGVLPPTLHCDDPHPALHRTRFRVTDTAELWEGHRRAAINAFGFGGINAHVVIEQGPSIAPPITVREPERVLLLSARTPADLAELLERDDAELRDVVTDSDGCRLGVVEPTAKNLRMARKAVAKALPWHGRGDVWFSPEPLLREGKLAFTFTGLEADFAPRVEDVAAHFGFTAPQTSHADITQHGGSVFAVGRLLHTALQHLGIRPDLVAGNSVGEWNAMLAAGVLSEATADAFWQGEPFRAPDVAFAALGCGTERLADVLPDYPEIVVSHENSPNQTIICGPPAEVDEVVRELRDRNVFGQVLPFRSGFHTPMLEPYLGGLTQKAGRTPMRPAEIPIWSATTASPYPVAERAIRELFIRHLLEPVRFRQTVDAMYADGARVFVQVGVGQLTSLIDDTLRGRPHMAVAANGPHRSGLDQLRRVATALWVEGGTPKFEVLQGFSARPKGMRLDLGSALVRMGDRAPKLSVTPATVADGLNPAVAAELDALLRETSMATADVLAATRRPSATRSSVRVSVESMPYLVDHTLVRQREGWPDMTDRRPVVPATTTLHFIVTAAERATGQKVVSVEQIRLLDWLVAAPALDVDVVVTPLQDNQCDVVVEGFASAVVTTAPRFPAQLPARWFGQAEEPPKLTAAQVYDKRWLFHGPLFQGVRTVHGISDASIRATLQATAAPGSLLDAVGQLLAHWMVERQRDKRIVFPMDVQRVRFFDVEPAPGEDVECVLRVRDLMTDEATFDAQLTVRGRVWCEISGWRDRRFHCAPEHQQAYYFPEMNTLSRLQDNGWWQVREQWPTVASRGLYVRKYLSALERADYERCSPRQQRQWLLGRIAAKDAVRAWLWEEGWGPLFPAEILVRDSGTGPVVSGLHGLTLPELELSIETETPGYGSARVLVKVDQEESHDQH